MAATGLLALLDDVTSLLDDVATMSKLAVKKTAGIAGDDLAVNAEALVGIDPSRELPIVGKVALGSVLNKLVLVPIALVLPTAVITPLLMFGGAFLCYEGIHKVTHAHDDHDATHKAELRAAAVASPEALARFEADKVRQALVTDLVLSAEIVAVALGAVIDEPLAVRATVVSLVALGMTVFIYGLVAIIVKLDDVALHLMTSNPVDGAAHRFGAALLRAVPVLMRTISVVGTAAMFLVGGGIILHGFHAAEEAIHHGLAFAEAWPWLHSALDTAATMLVGGLVGAATVAVVDGGRVAWGRLTRRG